MKACKQLLLGLALSSAAAAALAGEPISVVSVSTLSSPAGGAVEMSRPLPGYPAKALNDGVCYGRVLLGYDVASNGSVQDVQVLSAQPVQVFTRTALNAVQKWRYVPGRTDKRMVEFTFQCE
jgi:protein TonB